MAIRPTSLPHYQGGDGHYDARDTGQLGWSHPVIHYDSFVGRPAELMHPPLLPPLGVRVVTRLQSPSLPGYADVQPQQSGYVPYGGMRGYEVQTPTNVRPRCGHILSFQHGHLPYLGQPVDVRVNPYVHPIPPLHHLPLAPSQVYPVHSYPPTTERLVGPVEKEAYLAKLEELQHYVPSLVRALNHLSRSRMDDRGRESYRKLQFILRILQDKTTRVSLSSLMTYEFAIKKVCASRIAQTDGPHKRALESRALPDAKRTRLEGGGSVDSEGGSTKPYPDLLEESLLCGICQDIMHDCVCLQPCLHSYCSGCYSLWMVKSDLCPICRTRAKRIGKHHILNSIVESYLAMHPEKRRKAEDLNVLDKQNKIIHDMLWDESEDVWSDLESEEDSSQQDESEDEQL